MITLLLIGGVATLLLAAGTAQGVQRARERRAVATAQQRADAAALTDRVRRSPRAWLEVQARRFAPRSRALAASVEDAEEELKRAEAHVAALPEPEQTGRRLLWQAALALLLPVLVVVGGVLNVEVFIAVNHGTANAAAIGKGLGATALELLLTLAVGGLLEERERLRTFGGKLVLGAAGLLLFGVVAVVGTYAPARSELAYAQVIGQARLQVAALAAVPDDPTTAVDDVARTAAGNRLHDLQAQLDQGRNSDVAQAVGFPLVEALTGPFALSGAASLTRLARKRRGRRRLARVEQALRRARTAREIATQDEDARAAEFLWQRDIPAPAAGQPRRVIVENNIAVGTAAGTAQEPAPAARDPLDLSRFPASAPSTTTLPRPPAARNTDPWDL